MVVKEGGRVGVVSPSVLFGTSRSLSRVHSGYVSFSVPRAVSYGHIRELESVILPQQIAALSIIKVLLGGRGNRYG